MTGLTPFIVAMILTPDARLRSADPEKLAAKYGIPVPTAAHFLRHWRER